MAYVTADNFNSPNLMFNKVTGYTNPVQHHRVHMTYPRVNSKLGKLEIKTNVCESFGLCESVNDQGKVNYSFPFVMYNSNTGPTPESIKFMKMTGNIDETMATNLKSEKILKQIGKKKINTDDLSLLYQKDEDRAPTMYAKPWTKDIPGKKPKITTPFFRRKTRAEIRAEIAQGIAQPPAGQLNIKPCDPLLLINQKCLCVGVVVIDNIFVGKILAVQKRLKEVLILKFINAPTTSTITDVDVSNISEDEGDDDDEIGASNNNDEAVSDEEEDDEIVEFAALRS